MFKTVAFFTLLFFIALVNSASIHGNIPVKIIYEYPQVLRAVEQVNNDNGNDLVQEESELIVENSSPSTESSFEVKNENSKSNASIAEEREKNLEVRPQLSTHELEKADRYAQILDGVLKQTQDEKKQPTLQRVSNNANEYIEEKLAAALEADEVFGKKISNKTTGYLTKSSNLFSQYDRAKRIISTGLKNIRNNVDDFVKLNKEKYNTGIIKEEQWKRLNESVEGIFSNALKSEEPEPLNSVLPEFQKFSSEFLAELRQNNGTSFPQNVLSFFQNGFQQIQEALSNLSSSTPSSAAADTEVTSSRPNPIQSIQNAFNQFQQGISNLNPFNQQSTQSPSAQNDPESPVQGSSSQRPPLQAIQDAFGQFQQGISNLNPFKPTQAPGSQSDQPSTQSNPVIQGIQNASNQFGQAISNLNPFNRPSSSSGSAGVQSDEGSTTRNPLQGVQNAISQFGQAINNLNPFNQGSSTEKAPTNVAQDSPAKPEDIKDDPGAKPSSGFNTSKPTLGNVPLPVAPSSGPNAPVVEELQSPESTLQEGVQSGVASPVKGFSTNKPSTVNPQDQTSASAASGYQVEIIPSPGLELQEGVGISEVPKPAVRSENLVEMIPSISIEI